MGNVFFLYRKFLLNSGDKKSNLIFLLIKLFEMNLFKRFKVQNNDSKENIFIGFCF